MSGKMLANFDLATAEPHDIELPEFRVRGETLEIVIRDKGETNRGLVIVLEAQEALIVYHNMGQELGRMTIKAGG